MLQCSGLKKRSRLARVWWYSHVREPVGANLGKRALMVSLNAKLKA